jgi:amicyanin
VKPWNDAGSDAFSTVSDTWSGKESTNMNDNHRLIRVRGFWRLAVLGTVTFGLLAVAAWAPAGQSGPGTAPGQIAQPLVVAAQAGSRIEITKHKFSRPTLTVPAGTTVTWLNRDEDLHTVVSTTLAFKSAGLETDEAYSYTFAKPGVYEYFCTLHPLMTGKVIVK